MSDKKKLHNANDLFNPIALRKAKTAYNFGLSKCNSVKEAVVFNNFIQIILIKMESKYLTRCPDPVGSVVQEAFSHDACQVSFFH